MQLFEKLADTLNSGDEEVRTWFLVRNNYLPLIFSGLYVLFTTVIGPNVMKNREPFHLRNIMIVYNCLVVTIYLSLLSLAFWILPHVEWEVFCRGSEWRKDDMVYILVRVGWCCYLIKYIEFLDTIFMVLRKKQHMATFLHVTHHAVLPLLAWILLRTERGLLQAIPVILNSCVHAIMYTYYGLAAMGPKYRKYIWWKKHLTQFQMIQFCLVIVFVCVIVPLTGCRMTLSTNMVNIFLAVYFLILFCRFYTITYQKRKMPLEPNENAQGDDNTNSRITSHVNSIKEE